ncbi:MAG: copper-translocating P-type ATPase [Lentisphaerae bacterium GWF2_45_14]|nr:MAG: copper-translocating P-type ATPase [Lentisphaerae bacterium GWF2_45_14]
MPEAAQCTGINCSEHDHGQENRHTCPICGPISEGEGHERSMGRLGAAMIGGYFVLNSYILQWWLPDQTFCFELSALIGAMILSLPIIFTAVKDLFHGKVYMNELVALAILAAFTGGDFRTAGVIAFFLLVTIIIESRTASGAQRSIEELIKLTPHSARKIVEGREQDVDVLSLILGDVIRVRPGENFPIDGQIVKGQTFVNQASITGESLPVDKNESDDVFAGTQNLTGAIDVKVTKVGKDTTLGKVKDMILAAEKTRTPIVRIIDKYAGYYTPTILMIAGVTWWVSNFDLNRVITLMVIACPCAVVLATPSAIVAAVAAAARLGILIKNVSHLELAAKIKAFVFDKTGTLTCGILSVARLNPAEGVEPAELLLTAASVESHSNHPAACALKTLADEAGLKLNEVSNFEEVHGKGVKCLMASDICIVGRRSFLESHGISVGDGLSESEKVESVGMSMVYVACGKKVLGWIGFKDKVRNESREAISKLRELGIKYCAMVTGDRESVAASVAKTLDIEEYRSECLPESKVEYVEKMKKECPVAVVGDGVNDAPALAAGDLGIAMGAIGSDIAINSASIALMTNDLRRIPLLVSLSRKSRVIINQNLFIGMVFVLGGIILSVFGWMSPITAAVLHTFSTLIVLFNSARLVRTGEEYTIAEKALKSQ